MSKVTYFYNKFLDQNSTPKSNNNPVESNKNRQASEKKVLTGKNSIRQKKSTQVLVEKREEIQQSLKEKDIPSVSYYSVPLHLQPVFGNLGHSEGDFPVAEKVANQCLSLPMSPYLLQEDQIKVIRSISLN